jgi:hypothetical protein
VFRIRIWIQDPDPLVRGMDPRIRIHTKMSWIRNTAIKFTCSYKTGHGGGHPAHGAVLRHRRPRQTDPGAGGGRRPAHDAQGPLRQPRHQAAQGRVGKTPGFFFLNPSPVGFSGFFGVFRVFWVFLGFLFFFLGFFGFFVFFWGFFGGFLVFFIYLPRRESFLGFFSVSRILLGASRL